MPNALKVYDFTSSTGHKCSDSPINMTSDKARFITKILMSELDELACTVTDNKEDKNQLMKYAFDTRDQCTNFEKTEQIQLADSCPV